jgi:hypothetical protein
MTHHSPTGVGRDREAGKGSASTVGDIGVGTSPFP